MTNDKSAEEIVRRIEEIRARCEAATPGPWAHTYTGIIRFSANGHETRICAPSNLNDAAFIAHAREDIPYLLGLIESQAAEHEESGEMQNCRESDGCPTEGAVLKREWRLLTAQLSASQQETRAAVEESLIDFIVERDTDMLLAIETKDRRYLEFVLRQWRSLWEDHHEINK